VFKITRAAPAGILHMFSEFCHACNCSAGHFKRLYINQDTIAEMPLEILHKGL